MTQEELNKFSELNEKFDQDCYRVSNILRNLKQYKGSEGKDITYAENFTLYGDDVEWSGDEYWNYGGHEYHSGSFPKEFLTMSDKELESIVAKKNEEYEKELEAKKAEQEKAEKQRDFQMYNELKTKLGL